MPRKYRKFTEDELKIIESHQGKSNLLELSGILGITYTNFTAMLKHNRINFSSVKRAKKPKVATKENSTMSKEFNEKNEPILTDALMREWFGPGENKK